MGRVGNLIVALSVLILLQTPATTDSPERCFTVSGRVPFRITVPSDWEEIPDALIREATRLMLAKASGASEAQAAGNRIATGYQPSDNSWFSGPYVLTLASTEPGSHRLTEKDFDEFRRHCSKGVSREFDKAQESFGGFISDSQAEYLSYDKGEHIVFLESRVTASRCRIAMLSGTKFTQIGTIGVNAYCDESDYDKYKPVFQKIILSLDVDPSLEVRPRTLRDVIAGFNWPRILGAAIIGGLFGLIRALAGCKRKPRPEQDADVSDNQAKEVL